jgi:hypothetical protein
VVVLAAETPAALLAIEFAGALVLGEPPDRFVAAVELHPTMKMAAATPTEATRILPTRP